jgi:hypothetical protein
MKVKDRALEYFKDQLNRAETPPMIAYYRRMLEINRGRAKDERPQDSADYYIYSWKLNKIFESPKAADTEIKVRRGFVSKALGGESLNYYQLEYLSICSKKKQWTDTLS